MTIKELRKLIKDLPDDSIAYVWKLDVGSIVRIVSADTKNKNVFLEIDQ
jgi:hypothetical protein